MKSRGVNMNILETADIIKDLASCIAKQKGITIQEAFKEATEEIKKIQKEQIDETGEETN